MSINKIWYNKLVRIYTPVWASQVTQWYKESSCQSRTQEIQVRSLGREDPLEKEMATHSNILAWEIPWTEESGGL